MGWSERYFSSMFEAQCLFFCVLSLFFRPSLSTTFVVDGVSVWKDPVVHVGDSVIFRHKYGYDLYIFRNKNAFNLCNFTQATVLTKPKSPAFTWHPSRPGFYYFSFANASVKTCQLNQKLSVEVITAASPPAASPPLQPPRTSAPAPTSGDGGVVSSSPSYPWPLGPHEDSSYSPVPSPAESTTVTVPEKGGVPFINSNPAVPLPTGEVDSATINPLPTASDAQQVVVGLFTVTVQLGFCAAMFLPL